MSSKPPFIAELAGWFALLATVGAILLLASLHLLSPGFSPSWRMISEYALGRYAWVLSLMFLCCSIARGASWRGSQAQRTAGKSRFEENSARFM